MTQQNQFEADYLAAFPRGSVSLRKADGNYVEPCICLMTLVHQQQAARHAQEVESLKATHKAEIAELVATLKLAELSLCVGMPDYDIDDTLDILGDAVAKYEVKK